MTQSTSITSAAPSLTPLSRTSISSSSEKDAATAAAASASSSSPSSASPSLWSQVAPFDLEDAGLPFCRLHLWPLLDDAAVVAACTVNRATLRWYSSVPIVSRAFDLCPELPKPVGLHRPLLPLHHRHCWPAVTTLICFTWQTLAPQLPRLQQLRHLHLFQPVSECIDGLLPRSLLSLYLDYGYAPLSSTTFPPSLTELHLRGQPSSPSVLLVVPQPVLVPGCLPPSLVSLHYDANAVIQCGALPPSLRLLHLGQTRVADAIGLERGCLPASLTELRWWRTGAGLLHWLEDGRLPASLLTLQLPAQHMPLERFPADVMQLVDMEQAYFTEPMHGASLPRSLTELDLSQAHKWDQSLDGVLPPALRILRLGVAFTRPLTAATFSSCPLLHTLDMSAVSEPTPFALGALPASLTDLRYPIALGMARASIPLHCRTACPPRCADSS